MPGNNDYNLWTMNGSPSNNRYNVPWLKWYSGLTDYNKNEYLSYYDTSKLVDGDLTNSYETPWGSPSPSKNDISRYSPTSGFGNFGVGGLHYNYAKSVEDLNYYKLFTSDLFNSDGSFSKIGLEWAKSVDTLLPPSAKAKYSFFDNNGKLRNEWNPVVNNAHGQTALQFRLDLLKDYVEHLRNDQIIGPRHNIFLKRGKRYFYKDENGIEHWVNPNDINNYTVSENPVRKNIYENNVFWDDYELTGYQSAQPTQSVLNNPPSGVTIPIKLEKLNTNINPKIVVSSGGGIPVKLDTKVPWYKQINWKGLGENIQNLAPNIMEDIRLAGTLNNNNRVYEATLKGIRPNLMLTYLTHRQVVGDEATKQAYYRRGAEGTTRASQAFTSDADRQMAYLMEAQRQANELRAQGDLADNLEIRRTSDESNQHQWANTQRRAEVANQNIAQINAANQAKLNLLALKYTADWTSWDNFLRGREYRWRQRQAENKALDDLMWMLLRSNEIENDPILLDLQSQLEAVSKLPENLKEESGIRIINYNAPAIRDLQRKIRNRQFLLLYESLLQKQARKISFVKSGNKITYKKKDDLLYKSARDAVEHFRKMTKLTDDSYQKSRKKVPKLTPHPKGSVKKYQQGGVGPFGVFTPVGLGGEQTMTTESTRGSSSRTSSNKDDSGKDMLNLFKDLFSKMEGLPIDVSSIYAPLMSLMDRIKFNGGELSPQEISTIYIQSMLLLSKLKYNLELYNNAVNNAKANEASTEFVITPGGKILSQNINDGSFKPMSWEELSNSDEYRALTNNTLLELRANSPNLAFNSLILEYVNGTVGMNKVTELIKNLVGTIGETEILKQGYTKKEASLIAKGLEVLADAPDGVYEYTIHNKNLDEQVKAAFRFIKNTLPRNMRDTLKVYADMGGVSVDNIIKDALGKGYKSTDEFNIEAMTGKAAKDANGNSKNDSSKATFNDMVLRGLIGVPREFSVITKDGQTKFYSSDSRYVSLLPNVSSDMSVAQMLSESEIGLILDSRLGVTFGDQVINPENFKDLMFSIGGGATFVTLPCKYENGHKVVNFAIKDEFDDAIKEASKTTPVDWTDNNFKKNLADILKGKGLDSLLTSSMDIDPNMLGLFLVVEGFTTDRINFNKNSKYVEKVNNPSKELENRLNEALSIKGLDGKVLKYDVDINDWNLGFLFEGGWDNIYHANVFIPLNNDPLSAQIGNDTLKRDDAKELTYEKLNYLKLINAKNTNSSLL